MASRFDRELEPDTKTSAFQRGIGLCPDQGIAYFPDEAQDGLSAATRVETSIFYYPGQKITVDRAPVEFSIVPVRGTMQFEIPGGTHRVVVDLRRTPVRRGALILSIFGAFLVAAAIAIGRRRPLVRSS
jgi:hypothetical protein